MSLLSGFRNLLNRAAAECPDCGKRITAEEAEIGMSLFCPRCLDNFQQVSSKLIRLGPTRDDRTALRPDRSA